MCTSKREVESEVSRTRGTPASLAAGKVRARPRWQCPAIPVRRVHGHVPVTDTYRTDDGELSGGEPYTAVQQLHRLVAVGVAAVAPAEHRTARRAADGRLAFAERRRAPLLLPTERLQQGGQFARERLLGLLDEVAPALRSWTRPRWWRVRGLVRNRGQGVVVSTVSTATDVAVVPAAGVLTRALLLRLAPGTLLLRSTPGALLLRSTAGALTSGLLHSHLHTSILMRLVLVKGTRTRLKPPRQGGTRAGPPPRPPPWRPSAPLGSETHRDGVA